jgi:hypothetical protein
MPLFTPTTWFGFFEIDIGCLIDKNSPIIHDRYVVELPAFAVATNRRVFAPPPRGRARPSPPTGGPAPPGEVLGPLRTAGREGAGRPSVRDTPPKGGAHLRFDIGRSFRVRSGPGAARTILLFHIISAGPSKQPRMVRTFLKVHTSGLGWRIHCGVEVTESSTKNQNIITEI